MKNSMLKVASILYIIFASFTLLLGLLAFAGASLLEEPLKTLAIVGALILIVSGTVYIVAGIIGVKQKNAKTCVIVGFILIAVFVADAIYNFASGTEFGATEVISLIIGIILPALYLFGALRLKKDRELLAEEQQQNQNF